MIRPGDIVYARRSAANIEARIAPGPVGVRGFLGWYIKGNQNDAGALVVAVLPCEEDGQSWSLCLSFYGQLGWFYSSSLMGMMPGG